MGNYNNTNAVLTVLHGTDKNKYFSGLQQVPGEKKEFCQLSSTEKLSWTGTWSSQ